MPTPDRVYKAGDLVTIRLTEEDAYELGCGSEAKPTITNQVVIKHEPVPPPYSKWFMMYRGGEVGTYTSHSNALGGRSQNSLGILKVTIDPSKPFEIGKGVIVEIIP